MLTLDEAIELLEHRMDVEEIVELLDIRVDVLLQRFDDYVELNLGKIEEELLDEY